MPTVPDALRATILQAKLERPRLGGGVVSRPRLMGLLDGCLERRLTLVCAAPGFGKTTLLSAWLETCPLPAAWLSLDPADARLGAFLTYFVAAVRSIFPDGMGDTLALFHAQLSPPPEVLTTTLINDISRLARPFVLVLDDYHNAQSTEIDDLLGEFLRHWPQPMHLLVATRADPMLPLAAERAKSHLQEIRSRDLRFNREEIATYVQRLGWPADAGAQALAVRLEEQTEGWVAGLYLATLALRDQDAAGTAAAGPKIDGRYMLDYLADEVLARQPPAVQAFLMQTSILDRLCAPLAQALMDGSGNEVDAQAVLETLERTNLFTFALDDRRAWYRYHHLLQEMLRRQLEECYGPPVISVLHGRAGAWFQERGLVDEALRHTLAAGDFSRAAEIVEGRRQQAMNEEQWQRLEGWLGAFPREFVAREPRLLILEAWLAYARYRVLEVAALLAGVEEVLAPLDGPTFDTMRGEIDALQGWLAFTLQDGPQALAFSSKALSLLPIGWHRGRGLAWMASVGGNWLVNGADRAYAVLNDALTSDEATFPALSASLFATHGFLDWSTADLPGLLQTSQQMSRLFSAADVPDTINWAPYFRGVVHYQRNNLAAAEADFSALVGRPFVVHALVYLHSACGLALTLHAQGHAERAGQVVDDAMLFALEVRNSAARQMLRILRAELAFRDGDVEGAAQTVIRYGFALTMLPMIHFYAPHMTVAKVLVYARTPETLELAGELLAQLQRYVIATHNTRYLIEVLALDALYRDALGDEKTALAALERAVGLARRAGFIRLFVDLGPRLPALLERLRARGVARDYVDGLLLAFPASPPAAPSRRPSAPAAGLLTDREMQILVLLANRLSNKEIAVRLFVTPETVKRHTSNIYEKLNVSSRREAVAEAISLGILPPGDESVRSPGR